MAAVTTLVITHDSAEVVAGIRDRLQSSSSHATDPKGFANALINLVSGLACGARQGGVEVITHDVTSPTKATARITITHANLTAADTVSIGNVTFTARAGGAVANEFNIGADADADAVALAASINASVLYPLISAEAAATGIVNLTFNEVGPVGDLVRLVTSDATAYGLSGAHFGTGTGGTSGGTFVTGVRKVYNFGTAQT